MEISKLTVKGWQPIQGPANGLVRRVLNCSVKGQYADRGVVLATAGVRRSDPRVKQLVLPKEMIIDYSKIF